MKRLIVFLCLALLLALAACSTPPESSTALPPSESSSIPSSSVSSAPGKSYFITEEALGILDREPVDALYRYLWGNLTPKQYCYISSSKMDGRYSVLLLAPDKAAVETLLEEYTGPWAPVLHRYVSFTWADIVQAEADMRDFIENHPETPEVDIVIDEDGVWVSDQGNDPNADYSGLRSFAENYPIPGIYQILDYADTHPTNPD